MKNTFKLSVEYDNFDDLKTKALSVVDLETDTVISSFRNEEVDNIIKTLCLEEYINE